MIERLGDAAALLVPGALVIYYLANMWINTEGPFAIFEKIKIKFDIYSRGTWIKRGLMCIVCLSFWPAMIYGLWAGWYLGAPVPMALVYGLVVGGLVVYLAKGN